MRGGGKGAPLSSSVLNPHSIWVFFLLLSLQYLCILDKVLVYGSQLEGKDDTFIPQISPNTSPQPLIPTLAPSPLAPFQNTSTPQLSGRCTLNFSNVDSLIRTTAVDCWASFAPFLANVICCPQLKSTIHILIGQSSNQSGMLSLDTTHAKYCISDIQKILEGQGASYDLQQICLIHTSNLTQGSCPINSISEFESVVDSSQLLAACKRVDAVNECCTQICQNAILDAAKRISEKDVSMDATSIVPVNSSRIEDCRNVVLRWLSSRLDPVSANQVIRRISNCNVNAACPLVFQDTKTVAKHCGNTIRNHTTCCNSMSNYVSHLQKQSFITNLQALDCASLLGVQLQKMNVSTNIYSSCHITLKDFSLQVGTEETGCLLPSLPSDATFDPTSGISFTCDLNDNIAAPWPSSSMPSSSCNKNVTIPAFPTATSAQIGGERGNGQFQLLITFVLAFIILSTI